MILSTDRDRGRVTLSTKKLEPTPGDMLRNPQVRLRACFVCVSTAMCVRARVVSVHTSPCVWVCVLPQDTVAAI